MGRCKCMGLAGARLQPPTVNLIFQHQSGYPHARAPSLPLLLTCMQVLCHAPITKPRPFVKQCCNWREAPPSPLPAVLLCLCNPPRKVSCMLSGGCWRGPSTHAPTAAQLCKTCVVAQPSRLLGLLLGQRACVRGAEAQLSSHAPQHLGTSSSAPADQHTWLAVWV